MMGDLWPWVDDFQLNKLRAWGYEMVGSKMVSVFSITHFLVIRVFIWSGHGCFDKGLVGQRGKPSSKGLSLGMKRPTADLYNHTCRDVTLSTASGWCNWPNGSWKRKRSHGCFPVWTSLGHMPWLLITAGAFGKSHSTLAMSENWWSLR